MQANDSSSRNVLLTGGAGYIGSHVAVELQNAGYSVTILDNLSNSEDSVIDSIGAITGVKPQFYHTDLNDRNELGQIFRENDFCAVIHLAGLKAVGESVANPGLYYRENLTILINLLDAMRRANVNNFVFSSSATVYGPPEFLPYTEGHPTGFGVSSPYGWTKAMGEQIIWDYSKYESQPIDSISLRYFNPIGAHSSSLIGENPSGIPNNLMPYLLRVASGRLPELQIFGDDYATKDGSCERDYVHVVDLAQAHLAALERILAPRAGRMKSVYNIGTGKPVSVFEIVKAFEEATGVKIARSVGPRREGDLPAFYANASDAKKHLGWIAQLTLEDACKDSWNFEQRIASLSQ